MRRDDQIALWIGALLMAAAGGACGLIGGASAPWATGGATALLGWCLGFQVRDFVARRRGS